MYVPPANAADEATARAHVAGIGAGELVTVGPDGRPDVTLVPVLWTGDRVRMHLARANPQGARIAPDSPGLLVCTGPQAYVSPSWYATKAEHGRVVPTWNYTSVQLEGTVRVHDDPAWLLALVSDLSDRHEAGRAAPWSVEDAPEAFARGQLRGIVGVELTVTAVHAKAKLSQNRSEADRAGVVAGLAAEPGDASRAVGRLMQDGLR